MAEEKGVWRTVAGRRIFIRDGESLSESMKRSGKFKGKLSQTKTLKKDNLNKDERDFKERFGKTYSDEDLNKQIDRLKKLKEEGKATKGNESALKALESEKNDRAKTTSEDDSYAYKKNWSKEDAEKYIASQLKNNEGHDSVLLEKNGHYDVAKNWKEAEDAIKNHGWKHEKEDVDKIRKMAGLDKNNSEEKMAAIDGVKGSSGNKDWSKQDIQKLADSRKISYDEAKKIVERYNKPDNAGDAAVDRFRNASAGKASDDARVRKEATSDFDKEFMNSVKEKKYDNGRTEKTYDSKKEKKSAYGRDAVKLNDLQKEVANFSKDLDQDKWAKQMREDYVKQVYYTHARELKPVPHKGSDGKEYVYGNDSKNEYRIETSYLSAALQGNLSSWYSNAIKINSRAPREWQLKVDKLVKDNFISTYGTWEDYESSKKKKK